MKRNRTRSGITLIEMTIGVLVTSILIAILLSFFSMGLKGSQKGMENLTNMGTASILMSQIEYDLMRNSKFIYPPPGESGNSAQWEFPIDSTGGKGTVTYRLLSEGIEREEKTDTEMQKYIYCKDRDVTLSFDNLVLTDYSLIPDKTGVLVALSVSNSKKGPQTSEEFKLIRLITCKNVIK